MAGHQERADLMTNELMGRLAMRQEGNKWTAYYAMPGTMKDAVYLGQIAMRFVQTDERRDAFMALMKEAVGDVLQEITGMRPIWPDAPKPAPESERSGSA